MIKRILLSPGHSKPTPGKCSPDKSFYEWEYNRKLVNGIAARLEEEGIPFVCLDMTDKEDIGLSKRAAKANEYGKNCLYLSIHCNAAGNGNWMTARGWCAYTSKGLTSADPMCEIFMQEADKLLPALGCKIRKYSSKKYGWEDQFTVLTKTIMPAVLTESLFYDNKEDLAVLQSEEGFNILVEIHINAIKRILAEGM